MIIFDCPVGAPADVAELEYIAALQQTCKKELRLDATITAEDIRYFLVSRHGIRRGTEDLSEEILHQLAGSHSLWVTKTKDKIGEEPTIEPVRPEKFSESLLLGTFSEDGIESEKLVLPMNKESTPSTIEESRCAQIETVSDRSLNSKMEDQGTNDRINRFLFDWFPFWFDVADDSAKVKPQTEVENDDAEGLSDGAVLSSNPKILKSIESPMEQAPVQSKRLSVLAYLPKPGELNDEWEGLVLTDPGKVDRIEPIDLVQQTALLCIPELVRASKEISLNQETEQLPKEPSHAYALFEIFLRILCNTCQLEPGIELTKDVLVQILEQFGEVWSDEVIDEMWRRATRSIDGPEQVPLLTAHTLMQILTADIQEFPSEREFIPSIHYKDALSRKPGEPLDRIFTVSNLDYTADTYSSYWWANLAWLTLVITFTAYVLKGFSGVQSDFGHLDCDTAPLTTFGCRLANGIIVWIEVFLELTVIGFPLIYLSTMGNSVYARRNSVLTYCSFAIGIAAVLFYSVIFYSVEFRTKLLSTEKEEGRNIMYLGSLGLGIVFLTVQVGHFARILVPSRIAETAWFKPFASGMVRMERWTKLSAAFKMQKMLANALFCHSNDMERLYLSYDIEEVNEESKCNTAFRMAAKTVDALHGDDALTLLRFQEQADLRVKSQNMWTLWRQLISKQMQKDQGIWLSPRLGSSNSIQWFVVVLLPFVGAFLWRSIKNNLDSLQVYIPESTSGNFAAFVFFGVLAGVLGACFVALTYVPSAISLTQQFRTGVIGSLRDKDFLQYRKAQDTRTMLYGVALWGIIVTASLMWLIFGSLAFLFTYKPSQQLITTLLINILGFLITWMVKEIVLTILRSQWYRGLYRSKPAQANVLNIVMDCWNLGFSSMYIVARLAKLAVAMALNVGRVDIPFLSKDVTQLGPLNLDAFPLIYRKDLLSHDAHRHPYIERLGLLYLLKLRLGSKFGDRAGAAWRILFVVTLMPWLRRYRKSYIQRRQSFISRSPSIPSRKSSQRSMSSDDHDLPTSTSERNFELSARNDELRIENELLKRQLAQYEKALGRGLTKQPSAFGLTSPLRH